jgi:hypothetical protein
MNPIVLMLATPFLLVFVMAVVAAFFITLHRRRERAWANSSMTSPSVYVPGKVRTVQSPYYDTYVVAAASPINPGGVTKMFGNVAGINGIGPNITNMQQAFQLSGGESFLLSSFRVVPVGCGLGDVDNFMINNTIRLIIGAGNFYYCDAPAEFWAGGAGAYGGTSVAATNGIPDPRAIVPFDVDPILLTDGVNFRAEIIGTTFNAAANFTLRVYLDGQKTQPAQ